MHTFLVVLKDTNFFKDVMQLLHGDTMVPSAYPRNCDLCFSRKSSVKNGPHFAPSALRPKQKPIHKLN